MRIRVSRGKISNTYVRSGDDVVVVLFHQVIRYVHKIITHRFPGERFERKLCFIGCHCIRGFFCTRDILNIICLHDTQLNVLNYVIV